MNGSTTRIIYFVGGFMVIYGFLYSDTGATVIGLACLMPEMIKARYK